MKTKITTLGILQKGLLAVGIAGILGSASSAAPVPLPDWIKPIESSLPKLSPELISEMDELNLSIIVCEDLLTPSNIKKLNAAARRMVELGELSSQAMIWQYLKETDQKFSVISTLYRLRNDRDLAAWLLPIVRYRVEWLKQALSEKRVTDLESHYNEIAATEVYFRYQGEFEDMEALNHLKDELIKQGIMGDLERQTPQEQLQSMKEPRKWSERDNQPYWQQFARRLISEGVLTADALKPRPTVQNPGDGNNRPKPLGPRKPLPDITPPTPFYQPWMVWSMGLFIIVVSAGLLRWVFRRANQISEKVS